MLDAAVKVFSRRGYHAASMDEIAEDAGISKPMVYAYLGSKEQLFIACLHREGTRLLEAIVEAAGVDRDEPAQGGPVQGGPVQHTSAPDRPVPAGAAPADGEVRQVPDPSLEQRLWRGLRAFFGFVGAHRDGWAMLYRQARGEPPFAGELAGMRTRMVQVIAGLLGWALSADRNGQADDEHGPAPDEHGPCNRHGQEHRAARQCPDETELEVFAYALVGAAESLADWLVDHPEADPDRLADRVMDVLWRGTGRFLQAVGHGHAAPD